ncbi:hypothetical protein [Streptomyces sp. CoH17]|uniref:hypothetical protein n=1 Tax=Streptomyces sp. CoH17 TaxID=2992806 RepID=UPI00226FB8C8|nr:hypothetical protein [Streptomyces sp. CoH17]
MATEQTKTKQINYPIKAVQSNLILDIQCQSEHFYEQLQTYVRDYMTYLVTNDTPAPARLFYPAARIDYLVFPLSLPGGARRWDWTPRVSIEFLLAKDLINDTTGVYSKSDSPSNIYEGEIESSTGDVGDDILNSNPPH